MTGSAARGVLSGAVAGVGAWVAHSVSGGEVTPLAGLVAFVVSVALGPVLLAQGGASSRAPSRRTPGTGTPTSRVGPAGPVAPRTADPLRVAALTLLSQGVWHLVFMVGAPAPATTSTGADHAVLMLGAHLLAGVAATAVAVGLDRSLVQAAVRVAAALLPRPVVALAPILVPTRPAPVRSAAPAPLASARLLLTRVLRGPPARVLPVRG